MVLVNRTGTKAGKKGDPIWMRGVFLGKSDNDLYITWHIDGIKTSRSAKRCPDHVDSRAISSVGIHTWEVKHTTLATRAIPRKVFQLLQWSHRLLKTVRYLRNNSNFKTSRKLLQQDPL